MAFCHKSTQRFLAAEVAFGLGCTPEQVLSETVRPTLATGNALDQQTVPRARPKKAGDHLIHLGTTHREWASQFGCEMWWSRFELPAQHASAEAGHLPSEGVQQ